MLKLEPKIFLTIQVEPPCELPKRTLMDIQRMETFSPWLKCPEYEDLYNKFLSNQLCTYDLLKITKKRNIILNDCLLTVFKKLSSGVRCTDLEHYEHLLLSVKELLWYISPHVEKFQSKHANLPKPFLNLCEFNNPKRYGHKVSEISQDTLLSLVDGVNCHIEKSFVSRQNFKFICKSVHKSTESCVKYSDYLSQNKSLQVNHCNIDDETEPTYERKLFELPVTPSLTVYKTKQEHDALELLSERLENKDFYEPISIDFYLYEWRSYRHVFYKNLEEHGMTIDNVILFAQYYKGAMGNKYFVWHEDPTSVDHLTNWNLTVEKSNTKFTKIFFLLVQTKSM